ncbi:MAG: hypothetical protein LR015_00815 [Verrucomicrobia bacterium]|nr:hypothetical protein [Verrucomicrobiota bacterium]
MPDCKIRLDANAALRPSELCQWGDFLRSWNGLDYLEQPLPPGEENAMQEWSQTGGVALALDESLALATTEEVQSFQELWTGYFVLKPTVMGHPQKLWLSWRNLHSRCVLSSAFETSVGWWALLRLANELCPHTPIGAGWLDIFDDELTVLRPGPWLSAEELTFDRLTTVWNEC